MAAKKVADLLQFMAKLCKSQGGQEETTRRPTQERMLTTCIAAVKDGGGKITMGEGAALEKLEAAELEAWMKDRVVELIQECMRASADGAAEAKLQPPQKKGKLQRNLYLHLYLTAEEWAIMRDPSSCMDRRQRLSAARFRSLGLKCSTEPTWTLAVALMMMAAHQGPATSMQYNARACYSVLLDFKGVCRGHI